MGKAATTRRRAGRPSAPLAPGESVFAPRAYQLRAIADKSRSKAYMWSRQTGKGFAVALEINQDILEAEARGEATDWMIVSRSLIAARQLGRKVRGIGRALTAALKAVEPSIADLGESQFEITYPGGSTVKILSSNPDAAVGFTGNVVIDEIDTHKQAFDLLGNTIPVASTDDYRVIVTSTPRGRRVMHRLFTDSGKEGTQWSFHRLTIHEAVAQGCKQDPAALERQITAVDPLKWRQEYLCEFVDDELCWIPWELITACTHDMATMTPAPAGDGDVYAGWDVARWNDLSVLWIAERVGPLYVTRGVVIMKRMPLTQQVGLIATTLRGYKNFRRVCVDITGGMGIQPVESLQGELGEWRVEGVNFNRSVKEDLAGGVRKAMEDRALLIPDNEQVQSDFHSIRRSVTSAGNARFEGETAGSHADCFWAGSLCLHGASVVNEAGLMLI